MTSDLTRSAIAPADPGVRHVIRPSASRLARAEDVFTEQLHYEVVGLIPDLANHLGGDEWTFCQRTVQALLWSALTDEPPHVVSGALRRLGAVNQMAGFPEGQYLGLAHALFRAVRELTDDDWSTSLGSAWISYFQWMQGHLVTGAQQAPRPAAQPSAPPPPDGVPGPEDGAADLESVADLLEEEDDEDTGYGQIMVSMTRAPRRDPDQHPE
jgi:hypothetical protein